MKRTLLIMGVVSATAVSAQTITADDTLYTGLTTNYFVMDSNAVDFSAITGTGVTWNYSSLWAYEDATIPDNVIDASASSFTTDFPMAEYNDDLSSGTSIFFSNSGDDSMTVHGFVVTADGNEVIVKHNIDPLKMMVYPMALGASYNDDIAGEIEGGGFPLPSSGTATVTFDGYGTLNVSGNTHTNVSRVKLVETITGSLTVPPVTGTVTRTVYYYYDLTNDPQAIFVHANITVDSDVFDDNYTAVYYSGTPVHYLSVDEAAIAKTTVYPNPATDMVTITTDGAADELNIINALGEVVMTVAKPQAVEPLNVNTLEAGIYMIQVKKGDAVHVQKLVIE